MNDRELLYVKTIADTKSISKAAKVLFIAQPSLSQSIQRIEENIGTKLFTRNHEGMRLTLAGEKYYLAATEILNIYNDFQNEVTYINDLKKGRITIGITNFMGTYLLPKLIPKFIENYPNIEIDIKEENSTALERLLLNGAIDFAIMHNHKKIKNNSIHHENIYKDPFILVAKKDSEILKLAKKYKELEYPSIDIRLLKDERFILLGKNKRIRHVCDIILDEAGIIPNVDLIIKNYETGRRLASVGYGVTIIPKQYIKIFHDQYQADYFFIEENKHAYWNTSIATHKNMYQSKIAKVFIELVYEYFKEGQPI